MAQDPMKAIRKDIEKRIERSMQDFAAEMTAQIQFAYVSVIDSFYAEYTPRSYKRTFSTYLASDRANDEYGFSPVDGGYRAGINVDDSFIPGDPYRADKTWVFDRTFNKGIHGFTSAEYSDWRGNREVVLKAQWAMMSGKKKSMKTYLSEHRNEGILYGKSKKGYTGKFAPKKFYLKSVKAKTPREAMDKRFMHITSKRNCDMLRDAVLAKNFS